MPFGKIIINGDLMAGVEQFLGANRSDVSRAARDKHIHGRKLEAGTSLLNGEIGLPDPHAFTASGNSHFWRNDDALFGSKWPASSPTRLDAGISVFGGLEPR